MPTWVMMVAALAVGVLAMREYGRWASPMPAPVPAPGPVTPPGPAPFPPHPARPDWLPALEGSLGRLHDAVVALAKRPLPATTPAPDFSPLIAKLDEIGRKLDQPRAAPAPSLVPAANAAPAVYTKQTQPLIWYRGQWCTTGQ